MSVFAASQRASLLVLAAISDAQALERTLADTDVMDALGDTQPFRPADITVWTHMATCNRSYASRW
jgi:hypothetical protein